MKTQGLFEIDGEQIAYELERKPVKRMNLRVRRDGSVHVSVPTRTSAATVISETIFFIKSVICMSRTITGCNL